MTPASQGHVPFGPEVSWPNGFSAMEHPSGGYRYTETRVEQLPAPAAQGAHPYAAFNGSGYGDDGYRDPGYQGPSAQDAGIAATRTVRGFVEPARNQPSYPQPGYSQPGYPQPGYPHPGYAGSSYASAGEIEMAYPAPDAAPHGGDLYRQPWDYDQPLRYDGEEETYPAHDQSAGGYDGSARYQPPAYDPAAYNGSDYSMPGVNGPGYDLSGIIGTSDFEQLGYDEPSYGRLSYDDPRYDDGQRQPGHGQRFDETRFDMPRYDDSRLDNLWTIGDDVRREAGDPGYGNDGFGDTRSRSGSHSAYDPPRGARSAETRYDMRALAESGPHTRFDVPVYDETRLDNLRTLTPAVACARRARPCSRRPRRRTPGRGTGRRTRRSITSPTLT